MKKIFLFIIILHVASGQLQSQCLSGNCKDGVGTMNFGNNEIYTGDFKDSKRSGKGIMTYSSGKKYDGLWIEDKKDGYGVERYKDGGIYTGEWKNNVAEGKGTMTYPSGSKYEGDWKNDKKDGSGVYHYASGVVYEGEWKNDQFYGKGTMTYPSGSKYEGDWKNDKSDGKGIMRYKDGGVYDGDWKNDLADGKGTMTYSSGSKYEGDWKNDKRDGNGVMNYKDGSISTGIWANDELVNGYFTSADGKKEKVKKSSGSTAGSTNNTPGGVLYSSSDMSAFTIEKLKVDLKTVMADAGNGFKSMQGEMNNDTKYYGKYYDCNFKLLNTGSADIYYTEEIYYKTTKVTVPEELSFVQYFTDTSAVGKFITENLENTLDGYASDYKLKKKITFEGKDKKRKELGYKITTYSTSDKQRIYEITEYMDRGNRSVKVFSNSKNQKEANYLGALILYNLESASFSKSAIVYSVYGNTLENAESLYNKVRAVLQNPAIYSKYEWLPNQKDKQITLHLEPLHLHLEYYNVNSDGTFR